MLVAVAAGTVTFIGVVFSLQFLVVQFGSTTFTPRLTLFRYAPRFLAQVHDRYTGGTCARRQAAVDKRR
jgi:uncharacterized membrane protein